MNYPDSFVHKIHTAVDLAQTIRLLRVLPEKYQSMVSGVSGDVIGLRCKNADELREWKEAWHELAG